MRDFVRFFLAAILLLAGIHVLPQTASALDAHAGYYYPQPQTRESYITKVPVAPDAAESSRAAFVVGLAAQQLKSGHVPTYHLFAKGEDLEKLIIVATGDGHYDTLFRLRALLASLTSMARATPLFTQSPQPHELNFFDFCKLMGFRQVTVSNGKDLAHQIQIR